MTIVLLGMATIWALALGLTLYGTLLALRHHRASIPNLDAPFALYPVSILKPLKGTDEGLVENLESFFRLDYPRYEIIFSVADSNDPVCAVVQRVMARFPSVESQLIVGEVELGTNPKVNNLAIPYTRARHDLILISDSNVRVKPDYLKRQVAQFCEGGVGMVTAVVAGQNATGIGGWLEATYLNTFYARAMHQTASVGRPCVMGKSMLFQRSVAGRFGGIRALACYLAEDYMAGEAMRKLGLRVKIARDAIDQHIGKYSFRQFWQRHLRWGRIRKAQAPIPFLIEPLLGCMISGALGAIALHELLGARFAPFVAAHLAIWSFCDVLQQRRALGVKLHPELALGWFLREALAVPLWMHIAAGNTVLWRGRRLKIVSGGLLEAPTQ